MYSQVRDLISSNDRQFRIANTLTLRRNHSGLQFGKWLRATGQWQAIGLVHPSATPLLGRVLSSETSVSHNRETLSQRTGTHQLS